MSMKDMNLVRSALVYDGMGQGKNILKGIALYIQRPKENPDGSPGKPSIRPEMDDYCWASQERIAVNCGCSTDVVGRWVQRFQKDGWIIIEAGERDQFGHVRNRYKWTAGAEERLKELDWDTHKVERTKNPNKRRPQNTERLVQSSRQRAAVRKEYRKTQESESEMTPPSDTSLATSAVVTL